MNEIHRHYAGFWARLWAAAIDTWLLSLVVLPLLFLVYGKDYLGLPASQLGIWHYLLLWLLPAVIVCLFWCYRAATPGKMLIGAKIIQVDTGATPGYSSLVLRYLCYYVSAIVLFVGFIWIGVDERKQGLHDKIAATAVVYNPSGSMTARYIRIGISMVMVLLFLIGSYFAISNFVTAELTGEHDVTTGQYIAEGFQYGTNVSSTECWNQTVRRLSDCDDLRCKINQTYFLKACIGASYATTQQYK
ncbi:MAG: RDD family protein [Gammaproteobacteria bacterium]|nr:RDD family protein [Gammaproteobacteria bacterium]